MLTKFCGVILFCLTLCACTSSVVTSTSFKRIESQADISQINASDTRSAKVGEYLYRQAQQHKNDGITLSSEINIKPKNILKPNVTITPQNLAKTASKGQYDYYVAKTSESLQKEMLNILKPIPTQNKGIKLKQDGSDIQVFIIAGNVEHSYPLPKDTRWEKTSLVDLSKSAHENSLKYTGMQGDSLTFRHVKMDNVVKKNLLISSNKASKNTQIITIPLAQKIFTVEDKTIHILAANANDVQFRLTESKS